MLFSVQQFVVEVFKLYGIRVKSTSYPQMKLPCNYRHIYGIYISIWHVSYSCQKLHILWCLSWQVVSTLRYCTVGLYSRYFSDKHSPISYIQNTASLHFTQDLLVQELVVNLLSWILWCWKVWGQLVQTHDNTAVHDEPLLTTTQKPLKCSLLGHWINIYANFPPVTS